MGAPTLFSAKRRLQDDPRGHETLAEFEHPGHFQRDGSWAVAMDLFFNLPQPVETLGQARPVTEDASVLPHDLPEPHLEIPKRGRERRSRSEAGNELFHSGKPNLVEGPSILLSPCGGVHACSCSEDDALAESVPAEPVCAVKPSGDLSGSEQAGYPRPGIRRDRNPTHHEMSNR